MDKDIILKQAMESIKSAALMQLPEILRGNGDVIPTAMHSKTVTSSTVYKLDTVYKLESCGLF
jgi:hypothetical protein